MRIPPTVTAPLAAIAALSLAACGGETRNEADVGAGERDTAFEAPANDESAMESAANAVDPAAPDDSGNESANAIGPAGETSGGDTGGNTLQSNVSGM